MVDRKGMMPTHLVLVVGEAKRRRYCAHPLSAASTSADAQPAPAVSIRTCVGVQRQYLYCCTSKASKLWVHLELPQRPPTRHPHRFFFLTAASSQFLYFCTSKARKLVPRQARRVE